MRFALNVLSRGPRDAASGGDDLARRTIRTVLALVAACVLFVGLLSVTAVVVTSRLTEPGGDGEAKAARAPETAPAAKKPLSI